MRRELNSFRIPLRLIALLAWLFFVGSDALAQPNRVKAARPDSHSYHGITLADWRARMVDFDAQSPRAAQAVAPLMEIFADEQVDDVTRRNAAIALGNIREPARKVTPQLVEMVNEGGKEAVWAAKTLSLMGSAARDATPMLARLALDDEKPLVLRQLSLEALALIAGAHPEAVPALVEICAGDDELALRILAVEALGVAGRDAAVAAPILVRIIRNSRESDEMRRQCAIALGRFGDQASVAAPPLVETLMLDASESVRDAAALSLAAQGRRGESLLLSLLKQGEADVRWRAAMSLGEVKPTNSKITTALVNAFSDEDERVQLHAAQSLVKVKAEHQRVIPAILQLLESDDRMTRIDAVELLVSMGDDADVALPALRQLAQSERDEVRRIAEIAIKRLQAPVVPE